MVFWYGHSNSNSSRNQFQLNINCSLFHNCPTHWPCVCSLLAMAHSLPGLLLIEKSGARTETLITKHYIYLYTLQLPVNNYNKDSVWISLADLLNWAGHASSSSHYWNVLLSEQRSFCNVLDWLSIKRDVVMVKFTYLLDLWLSTFKILNIWISTTPSSITNQASFVRSCFLLR